MNIFKKWWEKRRLHFLYISYIPSDEDCYRVQCIDRSHPEFESYLDGFYNNI